MGSLEKLPAENGRVTLDQIAGRLQTIPFSAGTQAAIRRAKKHGAQQCILSDANQFSIATPNGLHEHFSTIITNRADVSEGKLSVTPWTAEPHTCENNCTLNLCKESEILKRNLGVATISVPLPSFKILLRTGRAIERIMKVGNP
ncbi:hypothetical protein BJ742DRAFT_860787 [Cladochytrium replicatum]|nr:hypothetical protein BJ742DRAFT_860787 [Cladochytrium replicatum]